MKQFKEYLEQQLDDIKGFIIERAKMYLIDCNNWKDEDIEAKYDLYDLDFDKYPINRYDIDDMSNHNFDLGQYFAIKNTIKELEEYEKED
jgi:hypothetical protein